MELKITYEIKGKERRELAQAISETLNIASIYKGVPSFEYEIGDFIIDREGSIMDAGQTQMNDMVQMVQENTKTMEQSVSPHR